MSKKKLNTEAITNQLMGPVGVFAKTGTPTASSSPADEAPKVQPLAAKSKKKIASNKRPSMASTDDFIDRIRKSVKAVGKEVSFARLTTEEKKQLESIVSTYKRRGVKTSENEVHRIAVNFLIEDYKANGQASVLAKVIAALLA